MKTVSFLVAALLLTAPNYAASAQPSECPLCRAMVPYGNCSKSPLDHPPEGAIGFAGTVLTSKPIKCGTQIRVEISRSTSPLPAIVEVAVRVCLYWHGKIGDAISAAVFDRPSQDGIYGAYGCWG